MIDRGENIGDIVIVFIRPDNIDERGTHVIAHPVKPVPGLPVLAAVASGIEIFIQPVGVHQQRGCSGHRIAMLQALFQHGPGHAPVTDITDIHGKQDEKQQEEQQILGADADVISFSGLPLFRGIRTRAFHVFPISSSPGRGYWS